MSSGKVTISVDALGADDAPSVVLDGVKLALEKDKNLIIKLCGPDDVVCPFAENLNNCEPVVCRESISMAEHPAMAIRKKKDSTIVVGSRLVKEGESDGFFSAGNTGACLAAATLVTGRIKGVSRPMLATNLPTKIDSKKTVFCDLGANADCKPENLLQFAIMASAYASLVNGIDRPKVALLNNGEEDTKGSTFAQETNALLRKELDNFAGNAEGKDLLSGKYDVIVTDGFTGNIVLKSMEGTFKTTFSLLKQTMLSSFKTKIGALFLKSELKTMIKNFDPESIGSALLFGVKGACCVGHGSSSANAICNGILTCADIARNNIWKKIEDNLNKVNTKDEQPS